MELNTEFICNLINYMVSHWTPVVADIGARNFCSIGVILDTGIGIRTTLDQDMLRGVDLRAL